MHTRARVHSPVRAVGLPRSPWRLGRWGYSLDRVHLVTAWVHEVIDLDGCMGTQSDSLGTWGYNPGAFGYIHIQGTRGSRLFWSESLSPSTGTYPNPKPNPNSNPNQAVRGREARRARARTLPPGSRQRTARAVARRSAARAAASVGAPPGWSPVRPCSC